MNKLFDYTDVDDCRNKLEQYKLVFNCKDKTYSYYHSYKHTTIKNKKVVVLKPSIFICDNFKTNEIFEMNEEYYKQKTDIINGKRK
jgi:hypothetical protein